MRHKSWIIILLGLLVVTGCASENPVQPPQNGQFFRVQVGNEQFTMLLTDPTSIQFAIENFQGKNHRFPSGRIAFGNGGFNQSWNWHYIPESIRMVEASIEVCDGLPSYVNSHLTDYAATGYCPWSGKITKVGQ